MNDLPPLVPLHPPFPPSHQHIAALRKHQTEAVMKLLDFRKPAEVLELPAPSLSDEAISLIGYHDALASTTYQQMLEQREALANNIERETSALAALDDAIARVGQSLGQPVQQIAAE